MAVHAWAIDKLVFYARNPRKNDAAVDRMCDSIREFGFEIPCLVRSDGEVIDGHLRLKAARKLGMAEISVILCDEWTPPQVKAFRITVNRSATWAEWDEELLAQELRELEIADFDLALTGFDAKELDELASPCRVPRDLLRLAPAGARRSFGRDAPDGASASLPQTPRDTSPANLPHSRGVASPLPSTRFYPQFCPLSLAVHHTHMNALSASTCKARLAFSETFSGHNVSKT
jgi:ParB-like chromosome segregation protein Spo0J